MRKLLRLTLWLIVLAAGGVVVLWLTTPDVKKLQDPKACLTIQVRDWKDEYHPYVVGPKNPRWVPLRKISRHLRAAVVAAEDSKFYRHDGFDLEGIKAAARRDLEEGRFAAGGSTITQQLAKNLYLSRDKNLIRKVREAAIAWGMERHLTKKRILELYLNVVELGPDVYGVESGARFYFGKSARWLNPKEAAFLAAMLPGPKVYNPYKNLRRVERKSRLILKRMMWAGFLSKGEYRAWRSAALNIKGLERKLESVTGEKQETVLPPPEPEEVQELAAPENGDGQAPTEVMPEGPTPPSPEDSFGHQPGGPEKFPMPGPSDMAPPGQSST